MYLLGSRRGKRLFGRNGAGDDRADARSSRGVRDVMDVCVALCCSDVRVTQLRLRHQPVVDRFRTDAARRVRAPRTPRRAARHVAEPQPAEGMREAARARGSALVPLVLRTGANRARTARNEQTREPLG
jgi:hypothetical protein